MGCCHEWSGFCKNWHEEASEIGVGDEDGSVIGVGRLAMISHGEESDDGPGDSDDGNSYTICCTEGILDRCIVREVLSNRCICSSIR